MDIKLETVFEPTHELLEKLDDGLVQFNLSQLGGWECHHIAVLARDSDEKIVGGICGTAQWDWFEIDLAWVEASERRRGIGGRLLEAAETAAATRNCPNSYVRTGSWQALSFYQKHGYEVFGQLGDYPKRHTTYFLKKEALGRSV